MKTKKQRKMLLKSTKKDLRKKNVTQINKKDLRITRTNQNKRKKPDSSNEC